MRLSCADDLLFIWLVLLNEYVTPVPSVANTTKGTDLKSLYCMIKNCGQKIMDCVGDTTCKKGLDCLEGCAFNDQVNLWSLIVYKIQSVSRCTVFLQIRGDNSGVLTTWCFKDMVEWLQSHAWLQLCTNCLQSLTARVGTDYNQCHSTQ